MIEIEEVETQVFKRFITIQAAIVKHGQSELIFLNENNGLSFNMEMPNNLPIDLKKDIFRFVHNDDTIKMKIINFTDEAIIFK